MAEITKPNFGPPPELFEKIGQHIGELQKRVAALESRPVVAHRGNWKPNSAYGENTLIQYAGSCWLSTRSANDSQPGQDDAWVLVAKRGRDGRSAT